MVLVHTEEELYASKEPAICVIGATSAEIKGASKGAKNKVYVRTLLQNDACVTLEEKFDGMIADPATDGTARVTYEDFKNERSRLVFGTEGAELVGTFGTFDTVVVLAFTKPI